MLVDKNTDKQLIGLYFANHADGSVGQMVPCTLGDERSVHGRRLVAGDAPKDYGKVHIGGQ